MKLYKIKNMALALMAGLGMFSAQSCKENIDMSDRYVFKDETIVSYLQKHEQYSEYVKLLFTVPISTQSASTVGQLMNARGNYTCFAPTNEAIQIYLDSLVTLGLINEPSWDAFTDPRKLDSIQKVIVYNSIIDGGDDISAYETSSFPTENGGEFTLPNMYDRKLNVTYDKREDIYMVSGCPVDERNQNIPAINGVLHAVNRVINPSNNSVSTWFRKIIENKTEGFYVMSTLVEACGLLDTLDLIKDEVYENLYQSGKIPEKIMSVETQEAPGPYYTPEHRYYGYTLFLETDEFWTEAIGKPYDQISISDVRAYIAGQGLYPDAKDDENYESTSNLLNQFVTYHILPERLPVSNLIYHYNERGYTTSNKVVTVPMEEFYTTMGKRRLLKIYQAGRAYSLNKTSDVYLNRFPTFNNGPHDDYSEASCAEQNQGILVGKPNLEGENDLRNAMVYPLTQLLAYDDNTRNELQKHRIRYDVASMWPEFINNDIRCNPNEDEKHRNIHIPSDNTYRYIQNAWITEDTEFNYWTGRGRGWANWQGDELTIRNVQDVTFELPPVPREGTYELRYGMQCGGNKRTMVQVYFGSDRDNMHAQGIPMDLRQGGDNTRHTKGGNIVSDIGWEVDNSKDDDYNAEVDKKLRNNDYMKGCNIMAAGGPGTSTMMRANNTCLRRILLRQKMDPNKTYYIRFKTVLDDPATYLYMDYLEYCAKEVYDNPAMPEDIW